MPPEIIVLSQTGGVVFKLYIVFKEVQYAKAAAEKLVIDAGNVISFKLVFPQKALLRFVNKLGTVTFSIEHS